MLPEEFTRFMRRVDKSAPNGCWAWLGGKENGGYGSLQRDWTKVWAHRVMWEHVRGVIPKGMHIHHKCTNKSCVNPEHLEMLTPQAHSLLGDTPAARNARKTHCKYGHPFSGDNLRVYKGQRQCLTCKARRSSAAAQALQRRQEKTARRVEDQQAEEALAERFLRRPVYKRTYKWQEGFIRLKTARNLVITGT